MLRRLIVMGLVAAAVGLSACGDDEDEDSASTPSPPAAETSGGGGREGGSGRETVTFTASPGGQLAFEQEEVEAPAGHVRLQLINDSVVPHNVEIEREGESEDIAETKTIAEGRTSTEAELEPGEYTFYCGVANHRETMQGTLTVR